MTRIDFQEIISLRANLDYEGRKELKESELERLAYRGNDPLDIIIYLQGLRLLWY